MLKSCMKAFPLFAWGINPLPKLNTIKHLSCFLSLFYLIGCGGNSEPENASEQNIKILPKESSNNVSTTEDKSLDYPEVRVEELDHSQEFFKEQHTTSFSYVPRKNWTSYTASKDGILTKVLLFGKANLVDSPHYGLSMSGFVRAHKPDSGPKYGKWSLSRDEIVQQLASQALDERSAGWLTIKMRGEIPQNAGTKYFIVCDSITENKAWFGEFSFADANPYDLGNHWLNPEHDLVMRTYVGKTDKQIKALQVQPKLKNSPPPSEEMLPIPISQNPNQPFIVQTPVPLSPSAAEIKEIKEPQPVQEKIPNLPLDSNYSENNQTIKKSLFDRLFKK